VQRGGVEVGPVRPNQCVHLGVDPDLVEQLQAGQGGVELTVRELFGDQDRLPGPLGTDQFRSSFISTSSCSTVINAVQEMDLAGLVLVTRLEDLKRDPFNQGTWIKGTQHS